MITRIFASSLLAAGLYLTSTAVSADGLADRKSDVTSPGPTLDQLIEELEYLYGPTAAGMDDGQVGYHMGDKMYQNEMYQREAWDTDSHAPMAHEYKRRAFDTGYSAQ